MFRDKKGFISTDSLTGTDTFIGQGTVFNGKINTDNNVRIEGEFHGEIHSKGEIIIGEFAVVKAEVECSVLTIAGQIHGDVTVNGRLIITPSGQLVGNTTVHSIIVQEGGIFNGQCQMNSAAKNAHQFSKNSSDKQENNKTRQAAAV